MAKDRSEKISISKEVLPELPPEYSETTLGDLRGAKRQYRSSAAHVREYEDRFTIHIDREDPRKTQSGIYCETPRKQLLRLQQASILQRKEATKEKKLDLLR